MADPTPKQTLIQSFRCAFAGLAVLIRTQRNARIHLTATGLVLIFGWVAKLSSTDWRWITLAIGLVWITEAFNTALEYSCDAITDQHHPLIKNAKDISAAATLIAAITAAVIGLIVFSPTIRSWFNT